jgi:UrcA family protein
MVTRLNRSTAALLAAIGATAFFAGSASYAQGDQIIVQGPSANVRGERVAYGDLNLTTRAGERTLERRVDGAVERVCLYDRGRWYGLACSPSASMRQICGIEQRMVLVSS